MIANLKPYPAYKDSGLRWLGLLPTHWNQLRAKCLFREIDERSVTGGEELLSVSHLTGVTPRSQKTVTMFLAKSNIGHKICRADDVVVNTMWAWMGALGTSQRTGMVSPAYGVYRPLNGCPILPRYADLLLRTPAYAAEYQRRSTGVNSSRLRLYPEHFLRIPVVVPPAEDQRAIVRFLNWANGRLDRTIRAKRKVIALLNEQKQAIIHRAVTRGLNPTASLNPSGTPWLGDIPQHWDAERLGRVIRIQTGYPFASTGFVLRGNGTRLLRGINVTPSGLRWDSVVCWQREPGDGLDEFEIQIGDIVLGMDRPIIRSGVRAAAVRQMDTPSLLLQRVARLRPSHRLDSEFLLLLLRGRLFAIYIAPIFTGVSVPHLSPQQIKDFRVPLPPLIEQQKIVSYVEGETNDLGMAVARLEREIELLREYRTRLVADVVTGKLDVREAAARLCDDAPDVAEDASDLSDEIESADEDVAA